MQPPKSAAKGEFRHYLGFELNKNLESLIDHNLTEIQSGQFYIPYSERIPTLEDLKQKHPKVFARYKELIDKSPESEEESQ